MKCDKELIIFQRALISCKQAIKQYSQYEEPQFVHDIKQIYVNLNEYPHKCIQMDQFKIEVVKHQKIAKPSLVTSSFPPQISLHIDAISCLNYPIEVLAQIIEAHFQSDSDEQPISANLVVKTLKIVSISLKDTKLRNSLQNILQANLHKKTLVYQLFVCWGTCVTDVMPIIQKFSTPLKNKIIINLFSTHYFTKTHKKKEISRILQNFVQKIEKKDEESIIKGLKDEYMLAKNPLKTLLNTAAIQLIRWTSSQNRNFMNKLIRQIIDNKESEKLMGEMLKVYLVEKSEQIKMDSLFSKFPNISNLFIKMLKNNLKNPKEVLILWINASKYKMGVQIKTAIREWVNEEHNYWNVFDQCFLHQFDTYSMDQTRLELFKMGQQVMNQKIVGQCVTRKYLYGYFEGLNFELEKQNIFVEQMGKYKDTVSTHTLDSLGEMIRCQSQCSSKGGVNIICLNIISGPKSWVKSNIMDNQYKNIEIIRPYIQKIQVLMEKIQKKAEKKSQKVQLAYHVITVSIKKKNQQIIANVSLQQLSAIMKSSKTDEEINYRISYPPFQIKKTDSKIKQMPQKKEFPSIVIQAFLVKCLKKQKNPVKKQQLFGHVNFAEQLCNVALKKIVDKGMAEEVGQTGTYQYVA